MTAVSDCALARLQKTAHLTVHSAYRNTVNLMTDDGLVALQTAGSPRSPLSVILPVDTAGMGTFAEEAKGGVEAAPNGSIHTARGGFVCAVRSGQTEVYPCAVPRIPRESTAALHAAAMAILQAAGPRGLAALYAPGEGDLVITAARGFLADAQAALAAGKPAEAAGVLLRLCGLGGGLTPAGDDFLCGAAAAVTAFGLQEASFGSALLSGIRESLSRTNDISAAFLSCAAEGLASEAVLTFFDTAHPHTPGELSEEFLAIGHSSGIDSLCGIACVLSYIKEEWL